MSLQDDHHHIAFADADAQEVGGCLVGKLLHLTKGEAALHTLVVGPQQG